MDVIAERGRKGFSADPPFEASPDGRVVLHRDISADLGYETGQVPRVLDTRTILDLLWRAAHSVSEARHLAAELERTRDELGRLRNAYAPVAFAAAADAGGDPFASIVGESPALRAVLERVRAVAPTDASVLITGETGTGKGVVAQALHAAGRRRDEPLVVVNCGALPASLIESELFGHEKGAFTGAVSSHTGRFELAHKGTIFLDEVGELPPEAQAKLLRVLQTGEFERLGGTTTRRVDVRVIAATNRDLEAEMSRGAFRNDLFYRLNVVPVALPPLRERRDDIPRLAAYLVEKKGRALGRDIRTLPPEVIERLVSYSWPGNVREMENVIERALILSTGPSLDPAAVFTSAGAVGAGPRTGHGPAPTPDPDGARHATLEEVERAHIQRVCADCGWRIKGRDGAARRLGLNPSTLYFRMAKLGVRRPVS